MIAACAGGIESASRRAAHCENGRRRPARRGPSPHTPQHHVHMPRAASRGRARLPSQVRRRAAGLRRDSESARAGPSPARLGAVRPGHWQAAWATTLVAPSRQGQLF